LFSVDDLNYTHLAPFVYTTRGMSILDHSIEESNDDIPLVVYTNGAKCV
jgi:hypothetical protein